MTRTPDRRQPNPPRIPFVRRCWLGLAGGRVVSAFTVNISSLGAYLTRADFAPEQPGAPPPADELPQVGEVVTCRFTMPESETEVEVKGVVSWLNPGQQHLVHSLPPGFGVRFEGLPAAARQRIEELVADYLARMGG